MNWSDWEKKHQADTKLYLQQVVAVYRSAVNEAAAIGATITQFDPSRPFSFSDYPQTSARINKLVASLAGQVDAVVLNGIDAQWTLSNNKNSVLCDRVFGDRKATLTPTEQRKYYTTNGPAREAFKARATNGLGLSDRVWKYTNQFKTEIELGLDLGLRDGLSAVEMTRDLKQYLQRPDMLFRRVRDQHGALRLSEAAKAYSPGRGVYRSSYKNALRLTSTETNIAYRTADFERWQGFDFVIGVEVKKSNNHPVHDMCDMLAGKYPKGFKFTGWHPNCRCYAVPILQEIDDFLEDKPATGQIESTPSNYNDWVEQNKDRFTSERNTPYFMRDNKAYTPNSPNSYRPPRSELVGFRYDRDGLELDGRERDCTIFVSKSNTDFIIPRDIDTQRQHISLDQAVEAFEKLPDYLRSCVDAVALTDWRNPMDSLWEERYGIPDFRSAATGGNRTITLYENNRRINDKRLFRTMCHEGGHNLDTGVGSTVAWKRIMEADARGYVSKYAYEAKSTAEDFADSVVALIEGEKEFKAQYPNRYRILKRIIRSKL